jgi:hypothetical protein
MLVQIRIFEDTLYQEHGRPLLSRPSLEGSCLPELSERVFISGLYILTVKVWNSGSSSEMLSKKTAPRHTWHWPHTENLLYRQ